jgi:hypothetical protein
VQWSVAMNVLKSCLLWTLACSMICAYGPETERWLREQKEKEEAKQFKLQQAATRANERSNLQRSREQRQQEALEQAVLREFGKLSARTQCELQHEFEKLSARTQASFQGVEAYHRAIEGVGTGLGWTFDGFFLQAAALLGDWGNSLTKSGTQITNNYRQYLRPLVWRPMTLSGRGIQAAGVGWMLYQLPKSLYETRRIDQELKEKLAKSKEKYEEEIESIRQR